MSRIVLLRLHRQERNPPVRARRGHESNVAVCDVLNDLAWLRLLRSHAVNLPCGKGRSRRPPLRVTCSCST